MFSAWGNRHCPPLFFPFGVVPSTFPFGVTASPCTFSSLDTTGLRHPSDIELRGFRVGVNSPAHAKFASIFSCNGFLGEPRTMPRRGEVPLPMPRQNLSCPHPPSDHSPSESLTSRPSLPILVFICRVATTPTLPPDRLPRGLIPASASTLLRPSTLAPSRQQPTPPSQLGVRETDPYAYWATLRPGMAKHQDRGSRGMASFLNERGRGPRRRWSCKALCRMASAREPLRF